MKTRNQRKKSISAWTTTWDPRTPPKGRIIHEYTSILYSDPMCRKVFPEGSIIPSNRRIKNMGELLKPTEPKRFVDHGPQEEKGYFTCEKCDLCKHAPNNTKNFKSPWDVRKWNIKKHITCLTPNVIYLIVCQLHENCWYIGSSDVMRRRWSRHKNDFKKGLNTCRLAGHANEMPHPANPELKFLTVLPIDAVRTKAQLLSKEVWWQENVGVHKFGLNRRNDLATVSRRRRKQ